MSDDEKTADSQGGFWGVFDRGPRFIGLMAAISGFFLLVILAKFLVPLLLAGILAMLTWSWRQKLMAWTGNRAILSATLLNLTLIFGIFGPILTVMVLAGLQARDLAQPERVQMLNQQALVWINEIQRWSMWDRLGITPNELTELSHKAGSLAAAWLWGQGVGLGSGLVHGLLLLAILALSLFYFHLEGEKLIRKLELISPLPEKALNHLYSVLFRTSRAIIKGNFAIGILQGGLTGILFACVSIPSSILFGVLAALASLIPSVGAALVWFPATVVLAAMGSWGKALVVLIGGFVISSIDNVVRPVLVGRDAGMHDLMVLLTTLGGISFFGPIGVLFGPLSAAICLAFLELWQDFRVEDSA